MLRDRYKEAIADFSKAIALKPTLSTTYASRGECYLCIGDYDSAIQDCTKSIELYPEDWTAFENRAEAYYHLGRFADAWIDIHKCREAGGEPNEKFIEKLKKACPSPTRATTSTAAREAATRITAPTWT